MLRMCFFNGIYKRFNKCSVRALSRGRRFLRRVFVGFFAALNPKPIEVSDALLGFGVQHGFGLSRALRMLMDVVLGGSWVVINRAISSLNLGSN